MVPTLSYKTSLDLVKGCHVRPTGNAAALPNSAGSYHGGQLECAHFTHFKVKKEYQKLFVECMVIF